MRHGGGFRLSALLLKELASIAGGPRCILIALPLWVSVWLAGPSLYDWLVRYALRHTKLPAVEAFASWMALTCSGSPPADDAGAAVVAGTVERACSVLCGAGGCRCPDMSVVLAACQGQRNVERAIHHVERRFCDLRPCIFVYDKCGTPASNASYPFFTLENVGNEQHTYLHHVVSEYGTLSRYLYFLPTRSYRTAPGRLAREVLMDHVREHSFQFRCLVRAKLLQDLASWAQPSYRGCTTCPASPVGLKRWALHHIGDWEDGVPSCHEGAFFTRREHILRRDKELYARILPALRSSVPEAGFYLERLAQLLYGKGSGHNHSHHRSVAKMGDSFP